MFSVCLLSSLPAKTVGSLISKLKKDLLLQLLRSPAVAGRRIEIFHLDAFFVNLKHLYKLTFPSLTDSRNFCI